MSTGEKMTTLVSQTIVPGTYKVEFSGTQFSSGIYFVIGKLGNQIVQLPVVLNK